MVTISLFGTPLLQGTPFMRKALCLQADNPLLIVSQYEQTHKNYRVDSILNLSSVMPNKCVASFDVMEFFTVLQEGWICPKWLVPL